MCNKRPVRSSPLEPPATPIPHTISITYNCLNPVKIGIPYIATSGKYRPSNRHPTPKNAKLLTPYQASNTLSYFAVSPYLAQLSCRIAIQPRLHQQLLHIQLPLQAVGGDEEVGRHTIVINLALACRWLLFAEKVMASFGPKSRFKTEKISFMLIEVCLKGVKSLRPTFACEAIFELLWEEHVDFKYHEATGVERRFVRRTVLG